MSIRERETSIAIVGAGPTGLSLALGLARHGVRSVVVERDASTSEFSKAAGVHLRTREIFHQWGIDDRIDGAGNLIETLTQYSVRRGARAARYDFSELADEAHRPGLLMLEQGRTEEILLEAARASGHCEVRFGCEAVGVAAHATGVWVRVRERGVEWWLGATFLVGCDGAGSFVRDALGLPFDGTTYSLSPMLADVRVGDERDALPWPRLWNGRRRLTVALRIRTGLWRIIGIGSGSGGEGEVGEVGKDEVEDRVREVLGGEAGEVGEVVWASRFRIHRRSSPRFRVGPVLLAGDAAHVHSPVGGQGMNAGVQDAHNLAWKLAAALEGGDVEALLDSYEAERRSVVIDRVSRYTDLVTRIFLMTPAPVREAAFVLLRAALRVPRLRRKIIRTLAMIDLAYGASPLLDPAERGAGVRLPNPLLRAPDGATVRLYDLLPIGSAVLEVGQVAAVAELPVDAVLRIGRDGHEDPGGVVRALLGDEDGWILVRPDLHIAWARTRPDGLRSSVERSLGVTRAATG